MPERIIILSATGLKLGGGRNDTDVRYSNIQGSQVGTTKEFCDFQKKSYYIYGLTVSFYFITQQRYLKLKFISGPVLITRSTMKYPDVGCPVGPELIGLSSEETW